MRKTYSLALAILFISLMISTTIGQTTAPSIPPHIATGQNHFFVIMQGDNPETPEIEPDGQMVIYDVMTLYIPWDVSRVYMHHPEDAELNYIMNVHDALAQYSFGDSEYDDWYYWEFSQGADRNIYGSNESIDIAGYSLNGAFAPSELNITEDGIALTPGSGVSEYVSETLPIFMAQNITSVTPTFESQGNVSFFLSNDGNTWIEASNGVVTTFQTLNTSLKYKVILSDDPVNSSIISDIRLDYSYIPITTRTILRAEYIISSDHEPPVFKIQKQFLYDITEIDVRLYLDPGFDIFSENITWKEHFQIDPSIQIENKTLYQGSATIDSYITISLLPEVTEDTSNPYLYPIVIVIIIILLTGILLYRRNAPASPEEDTISDPEEAPSESEGTDSESDDNDDGIDESGDAEATQTVDKIELTLQRDKIVLALKTLDEDLENNNISQEAYDELRSNYKAEAIRIMKELDKGQ